jgi:3-dehydroquinate synthase
MNSIRIDINQNPIVYDIKIGNQILKESLLDINGYHKALIIHDSAIHSNIISLIIESLADNNIKAESFPIDISRYPKSISTFISLSEWLPLNGYNKDSLLISLGGGSIGDLVGFVASSYYRGIDYIQIPSTLLSMIDSSIGGKTGLDTEGGKNLIGSFYHPQKVIIDTCLLSSLDDAEINSGLFEAVKYAILFDRNLFDFIDKHLDNIRSLDVINRVIIDCCRIKSTIIEHDEKDLGDRMKLNFGHTIGHAIESIYGLRHGESVGYGMRCAIDISKQLGTLSEYSYNEINTLLCQLPLPDLKVDIDLIINQLAKDKKVKDGKNNFILLNDIGNSYISNDVSMNIIKNSILNL